LLQTKASFPFGSLISGSNDILYGTARSGGINNSGVLFKYSITGYSKLYDFATGNEKNPGSGLLLANGKLYGMAQAGGLYNAGSIYSFDTATNTCSTIFNFDTINGSSPSFNTLMQSSNEKIYGMTLYGGTNNMGVVFSLDSGSNTFTKLIDFNGTNGKWPNGTLTELKTAVELPGKLEQTALDIYPNPVLHYLYLSGSAIHDETTVSITGIDGRKVSEARCIYTNNSGFINVERLSPGIYILQYEYKGGAQRRVFVKQ
jgi:uncharacterized repeat protein (TIGR03803 family)